MNGVQGKRCWVEPTHRTQCQPRATPGVPQRPPGSGAGAARPAASTAWAAATSPTRRAPSARSAPPPRSAAPRGPPPPSRPPLAAPGCGGGRCGERAVGVLGEARRTSNFWFDGRRAVTEGGLPVVGQGFAHGPALPVFSTHSNCSLEGWGFLFPSNFCVFFCRDPTPQRQSSC